MLYSFEFRTKHEREPQERLHGERIAHYTLFRLSASWLSGVLRVTTDERSSMWYCVLIQVKINITCIREKGKLCRVPVLTSLAQSHTEETQTEPILSSLTYNHLLYGYCKWRFNECNMDCSNNLGYSNPLVQQVIFRPYLLSFHRHSSYHPWIDGAH